ncbi:ArsR/SmtB family transcription factor [Levilactobacillus namurensis]|uniref:Metalloregulator ArsR/SmtB family transcription factor n=1 Tax=Levilactobacillus namurensis TaxID=380393 RepID=A0AAW8W6D4_9LACO|nr:metalloregulator ArsR/SmtB family transcription factor [Levilactobacillus namurensis]MDT7013961.1 metalloregulator ArsR/SmtB family transcription factor [Levilactobacillus namurensis]
MTTTNLAETYRDAAYTQLVRVGKALGNSSRLKLLNNLVQGPKTVEELAKTVGLSVGTASKNLQLLKQVGLVRVERRGNYVVYELASAQVPQVLSLLVDVSEQALPELRALEQQLSAQRPPLPQLSITDITRELATGQPYLIDLRPADEYQVAHLPGAHNFPYDQIMQRLAEIPRDRELVVYCRGRLCGYSEMIGQQLKDRGYQVQIFQMTVWEWQQAQAQ